MDPDACLAALREKMRKLQSLAEDEATEPPIAELGTDVVEGFDALDTWISMGGFLPAAWRETKET